MKLLLDLAATQSVGFVVGVLLIFLIAPDTRQGALFLIILAIGGVNAIREIARMRSKKKDGNAPNA